MIIRAVHNRSNPYFIVRRDTAQDSRLPARALGVLVYLFSKPDDWEPAVEDICRRFKDIGREQCYRIINETLIPLGYAKRVCERENGRVIRWITEIYETPVAENQHVETPDTGFPDAEIQDVVGPDAAYQMLKTSTIQNKRVQNTERQITEAQIRDVARVKPRATKRPSECDEQYLLELQASPAYSMLNVQQCYYRAVEWCRINGRQPTRRFFINWLNREDKPMTAPTPQNGGTNGRYQVPRNETYGERAGRQMEELFANSLTPTISDSGPNSADTETPWPALDSGGF